MFLSCTCGMQAQMGVKPCEASSLSMALDAENGNFNGMSHSGVLLVLRNIGPATCSVPARADLTFEDTVHRPLAITWQKPVGMHPGPVMIPVAIPAGAEATATLTWVSGDVYDGHNCVRPAFVIYTVGETKMSSAFSGQICGPAGKPVTYQMTVLNRNPIYLIDK